MVHAAALCVFHPASITHAADACCSGTEASDVLLWACLSHSRSDTCQLGIPSSVEHDLIDDFTLGRDRREPLRCALLIG